MGYLEDFKTQINNRDFAKFMQLWEEYCSSDHVETEEFIALLKAIKGSEFAKQFGPYVETGLALWQTVTNKEESYQVLKNLIDLQTTNSKLLADTALDAIKSQYKDTPQHNERLRLIGLRTCENFQGALSSYDLLDHIQSKKFVYHTGGWGTGEIVDVSHVREQMAVEFENVSGRKHISFLNAFKVLTPLPNDNFLARRFSDPDQLEQEAKNDPLTIVKLLLRDLGPKTAAEIKDELCELVIPEKEWAKWWQAARAKLKKDPHVQAPENTKDVFSIRKTAVTHEQRLHSDLHSKTNVDEIIKSSYNIARDLPKSSKKQDGTASLRDKLLGLLSDKSLTKPQELQILILLEDYFDLPVKEKPLNDFVKNLKDLSRTINSIEILALKKKALGLVKEAFADWVPIFCSFLQTIEQGTLRDYLFKELQNNEGKDAFIKEIEALIRKPKNNPELFLWYFQKATAAKSDIPFSDKEGQCKLLEAFFILLSNIETNPEFKDLTKKMYTILLANRYAVVRQIIEGTSLEYIKEYLLLTSKCQTFSNHDIKILRSLAEVVHPSLIDSKLKKRTHHFDNVLWTTEAGYKKTQERAQQIGTIEVIDNAKEIEAARALGDLRENSEYKFAQERRARLQGELKVLSDQLKNARLITPDDISSSEVGIGCLVTIVDSDSQPTTYTILGPWEADPEKNILSFQSKLAEAMLGLKVGETFDFRDETFTISTIKSYLDK